MMPPNWKSFERYPQYVHIFLIIIQFLSTPYVDKSSFIEIYSHFTTLGSSQNLTKLGT